MAHPSAAADDDALAPLLPQSNPSHQQQQQQHNLQQQNQKLAWLRWLLVVSAAAAALALAAGLPVVYFVVVPNRIAAALAGNGSHVLHVRIANVNHDAPAIAANVSLAITLQDPSPLEAVMEQAPLALYAVEAATATPVRTPVATLMLPRVVTPRLAPAINLSYIADISDINVAYTAFAITRIARHGPSAAFAALDVAGEASPLFRIPHLGSWVVPMRQLYHLLPIPSEADPAATAPFSIHDLDINLVDASILPITTPSGKMYYKVTAIVDFTNPLPFSIDPAVALGASFTVFSTNSQRLVDIAIPPKSLCLSAGRNRNVVISAVTDQDNTELLMELVGLVADGKNISIVMDHIHLDMSLRPDRPVVWLDDMLSILRFNIPIRGSDFQMVLNRLLKSFLSFNTIA